MFLNKDDFKLNNISMGEYLTTIEFVYNDIWSENTGYSLSNKFIGEFKGTIPKFILNFRRLTPTEIEYLTKEIFRKPTQSCVYRDPELGIKTINVHKGDVSQTWYGINKSKPFSFSVVGNEAL